MNHKYIKTRFYNQLKVEDNKVIKLSDSARIHKEYNWYLEANKYIPEHLPQVVLKEISEEQSSLIMELIDGPNLFEYIQDKEIGEIESLLQNLESMINSKLHNDNVATNLSDISKMYLEKPLKSIEYFYSKYLKYSSELNINNRICKSPLTLLHEIYTELKDSLSSVTYTFIHGDLTLSNSIIDRNNKIYLIDPRGGFGDTVNYGDPRYDIAKLYYSLVGGFDSLNHHRFNLIQSAKGYQYQIANKSTDSKEDLFWNYFPKNKELIKFIHSTIWLSLIPHLEESREQTLTAFLNGTYLLNNIYG